MKFLKGFFFSLFFSSKIYTHTVLKLFSQHQVISFLKMEGLGARKHVILYLVFVCMV